MRSISELMFFIVIIILGILYLIAKAFIHIELASEDNIDLLVVAGGLFIVIFIAIFLFEVQQFVSTGILTDFNSPQPENILQLVGYLFTFPAALSVFLLPYFRLIATLRRPDKSNVLSLIIIGIVFLLEIFFKSQLIIIAGFTLSYLISSKQIKLQRVIRDS